MIKIYKYKLYPNNKQNTRMFDIASATRFAYNWALSSALTYFENNKKAKVGEENIIQIHKELKE